MATKKSKNKAAEDFLNDKSSDLLLRHEAFIEEYLICMNGTLAYQTTHPDVGYDTASVNASKLLRNTKIKAELERRFGEEVMTKKEVLKRLRDQANATLHAFVKVDDEGHIYFNFKDKEAKRNFHLIKKVKHRKNETYNERSGEASEEHWVEVELHDPQRALELIGKYHALFTDKTESNEKKTIRVTIKKEE